MPHATSRPTGVLTSGGAVTGPFHHRTARAVVLALLLAVLPAELATATAPEFRGVLTGIESATHTKDIPLCC
ncbi:hypothetical protein ACGFX2_16580 [Streptomyces goshikiensis]|uniref:hypothetical protein n=1 Tax=Streptomyces goshikiensis TaxID=1942 RepID=UPI0037100288